ncbi:MAG: transposase [Methanobrevibacter sp. CfCl-M3]
MTIINNEPKVHIEDHLLISDIDELMSECNIYIRLYERLLAIKMLKKGLSIDETVDFVNVSPRTVYNWLKTYNKKGLAGLIPNFGGGRPSYLSDKDLTDIKL